MNQSDNITKVLYLTWGENIGFSGLFREQVVSTLINISRLSKNVEIALLSGIPISRSLLYNNRKYRDRLSEIKIELKKYGIPFKYTLIPVLSNMFYSRIITIPFYYLSHITYLHKTIIGSKINVIHCRSYHAAFFAAILKHLYRLEYKIIFDTRGAFPEEGAYFKFYSKSSLSFKLWKYIENYLFDQSAAIVFVSKKFILATTPILHQKKSVIIPTSSPVELYCAEKSQELFRKLSDKYRLNSENKILVYLGVIGNKSWYSITKLLEIYNEYAKKYHNSNLLIISKSKLENVHNIAKIFANIDPSRIILAESNLAIEISHLLSLSHMGVYPTRSPSNVIEKRLIDVLIAAKTGEYLSSGLPIIVPNTASTLASLVTENNMGVAFSSIDDMQELLTQIDTNYTEISRNCISYSKKTFSNLIISKKYIQLYTRSRLDKY
jgi:hypothetical protein